MQTVGPLLQATCAVLKGVAAVARPVAKIAGVDVPQMHDFGAVAGVGEINCGYTTVETMGVPAGMSWPKQWACPLAYSCRKHTSQNWSRRRSASLKASCASGDDGSTHWVMPATSSLRGCSWWRVPEGSSRDFSFVNFHVVLYARLRRAAAPPAPRALPPSVAKRLTPARRCFDPPAAQRQAPR